MNMRVIFLLIFFFYTLESFAYGKKGIAPPPESDLCPYELNDIPGKPPWTSQEHWAWNQICVGKEANMAQMQDNTKKIEAGSVDCDPTKERHHFKMWSSDRVLSPIFLKTIMLVEPYRGVTSTYGIIIECAIFEKSVEINDMSFPSRLWLDYSVFLENIQMTNLRMDNELSIYHSWVDKGLFADRMSVNGNVFFNGTRFFVSNDNCEGVDDKCAIKIVGAKIKGDFSLSQAIVSGRIKADGVFIEKNLNLRNGEYEAFDLIGANIGEDISVCDAPLPDKMCKSTSRFKGSIRMDGTKIGGHLALNGITLVTEGNINQGDYILDLVRLDIGGRLEIINSHIEGDTRLDGTTIKAETLLHNTIFHSLTMIGSNIGSNLSFVGSTINGKLDLSYALVLGELTLAEPVGENRVVKFIGNNRELSLRNVTLKSIQDWNKKNKYIYENLQGRLVLAGLIYDRFGNSYDKNTNEIFDRLSGKERVDHWLSYQIYYKNQYLPQPFEQLAKVLETEGFQNQAIDVKVASKDHELASPTTPNSRKGALIAQKIFIEYGYSTWRAFAWFIFLVLLGAMFLKKYRATIEWPETLSPPSFSTEFWFSLDRALPLLELSKEHEKVNLNIFKQYFYIHHLVGFILATFIVAGISGLTK